MLSIVMGGEASPRGRKRDDRSRLASRAIAWLRSPEGILGTLATSGLVVNLVLPIFGGLPASFADLVGYAFVFAVFYEFPPRVLPARGRQFAELQPVRLIVAATGLANTAIITGALRETISHWWVIGVLVVSFVVLALYVRFSPSIDLDNPNDPAVNAMAVISHSRVEDSDGEVWDHPIGREVGTVVLGLTVATFGFITGLFGPVIDIAWPLPELLVVGWIGYEHAASRLESISGTWLPNREQVDVSSRLFASAANLLRSNVLKGATVLAIIQLPVVWSAVILAAGVFAVAILGQLIWAGATRGGVDGLWAMLWVAMLTLACFTYGGYTAWFWLRELERLPTYFVAWSAEHMPPADRPSDDWSPPDPPTRPPDYLLVASLLYGWLTVAALLSLTRPELVRSPSLLTGLLVAAWGGLLIGIYYSVSWTLRRQPQPVEREDQAFFLSFLLQYFSLALGTHFLLSHPELSNISPLPGGLISEPAVYLVPIIIVLVFYGPDVGMRTYAASGVRRHTGAVYLLVIAAMFAGMAVVWAEASLFLWAASAVIVLLLIPLFYVAGRFVRDGG